MSSSARAEARRIDLLISAALTLARSARTGRLALARLAASIELDWLPPDLGDELPSALRDAGRPREPLSGRDLEATLKRAWGVKPGDELDDLEREPVAVTPTSQVHRATLEGRPVAVKVVDPGLAPALAQDLGLLDRLLGPLEAAFPALDSRALMREVRERALEELDLEFEAGVQRRFHRALRDHPFLSVPAPVSRLARANILVSEWAEGTPLTEAGGAERDGAAANLVAFAFGAARFGVVHADLDPRDVLIAPAGGLVILDFGATRSVDPARTDRWADAVEAFADRDTARFADLLDGLGWLPAAEGARALGLARHALGPLGVPGVTRLDSAALTAARDRAFERPDDLLALLLRGSVPPEDAWPARGFAQLFGTVARVGATGDWLALTLSAARAGWDPPAHARVLERATNS